MLVAVSVAAMLGLSPSQASEQTFTVTTTSDAPQPSPSGNCISTLADGRCTLRAAVQAANFLTGGPHTINLGVAGTYLLAVNGPWEDAAATGDLDLNNVNVRVANTSGGTVVIDANRVDRVFDVGPTRTAQLALSDVTVQNGAVGERTGAASGWERRPRSR